MAKVKICGLSRLEDITAVNAALPDYIGFVFAPSRRQVDQHTAAMLKKRLDPRIKAVGVFVNEEAGVIAGLYRNGVIDLAQLHGDEDGGYVARVKEVCPVIKAVGVDSELPTLPDEPDYLLFDSIGGGTGRVFDWSLIGKIEKNFFLAGGLTLANVTEAITLLSPFCVDVSGGVETDGVKDADKIKNFVRSVKKEAH